VLLPQKIMLILGPTPPNYPFVFDKISYELVAQALTLLLCCVLLCLCRAVLLPQRNWVILGPTPPKYPCVSDKISYKLVAQALTLLLCCVCCVLCAPVCCAALFVTEDYGITGPGSGILNGQVGTSKGGKGAGCKSGCKSWNSIDGLITAGIFMGR
jgi:hypothetical protein